MREDPLKPEKEKKDVRECGKSKLNLLVKI